MSLASSRRALWAGTSSRIGCADAPPHTVFFCGLSVPLAYRNRVVPLLPVAGTPCTRDAEGAMLRLYLRPEAAIHAAATPLATAGRKEIPPGPRQSPAFIDQTGYEGLKGPVGSPAVVAQGGGDSGGSGEMRGWPGRDYARWP